MCRRKRRVCRAHRRETEHEAAKVCDLWRHGGRELAQRTRFQVAGVTRTRVRCKTQMKTSTEKRGRCVDDRRVEDEEKGAQEEVSNGDPKLAQALS